MVDNGNGLSWTQNSKEYLSFSLVSKTWSVYDGEAIPTSGKNFQVHLSQNSLRKKMPLVYSILGFVCQGVEKRKRGKSNTVIILRGKEFYRRDRLSNWPKT